MASVQIGNTSWNQDYLNSHPGLEAQVRAANANGVKANGNGTFTATNKDGSQYTMYNYDANPITSSQQLYNRYTDKNGNFTGVPYADTQSQQYIASINPDYKVPVLQGSNATNSGNAISGGNAGGIQVYDPTNDIKAMADAQKKAALAGLDKAHNQSLSDLNYAKGQIEPAYYTQRNNVSTDSQIAAKNFAEYMAQRGNNNPVGISGTMAQSDIANNVALQGNLGNLAKGQAADYAQNAKQVADLNTAYNNDVASTNAGIDASTMQSLINAQQAYNAQKLAQYNADRAFNYQVGRDTVNDTGYNNGVQTIAGQQALANIANTQANTAGQNIQNQYQPQLYQGQITQQDLQNQTAALQLKYQPQIYQGQIDGQALQNAYQTLVNNGYPAQQAADLAYKAAQTANVNKSTSLMGLKSSGSGGGGRSGSSSSNYKNTDYKNSDQKTIHDYANSNATLAEKLQALSGAANDTEMSSSDRAYAKYQQEALLAGRWYAGR